MKCDKLEEEYLWTNNVKTPSTRMVRVYNADEVDAAIAELKQKLEDAKATAYTESVDAGMENRRLKRALWLARAERAKSEKGFWEYKYNEDCGEFNYTIASRSLASDEWMRVWENVERKCRAKAESYL